MDLEKGRKELIKCTKSNVIITNPDAIDTLKQ
jgi:hypothetical protein